MRTQLAQLFFDRHGLGLDGPAYATLEESGRPYQAVPLVCVPGSPGVRARVAYATPEESGRRHQAVPVVCVPGSH